MSHRSTTLLVLSLTLVSSVACHPPATIVTPQGRTAFAVDQVVQRINELENVAIQANASGGLAVQTTRILVTFAVSADRVLKAAPAGWQQTLTTLWMQAKADLPPISNPVITAAISAVDVVLARL